jgi:hypothetical protein
MHCSPSRTSSLLSQSLLRCACFQDGAVSAALKYVHSTFAELQLQSPNGTVERREALALLEAMDNILAQVASGPDAVSTGLVPFP